MTAEAEAQPPRAAAAAVLTTFLEHIMSPSSSSFRLWQVVTLLGLVSFGVWMGLRRSDPSRPPANPSPQSNVVGAPEPTVATRQALDHAIRQTEAQLRALDSRIAELAWWQVRGLGPHAPDQAKTTLAAELRGGELSWLTTLEPMHHPELALQLALSEAKASAPPDPSELRATTLADQAYALDALGQLAGRSESPVATTATPELLSNRLAHALERALQTLSRPEDANPALVLHLAQAVIRAAPLVLSQRTDLLLRRTLGRLGEPPNEDTALTAAARLEMLAAFSDVGFGDARALESVRQQLARVLRDSGKTLTPAILCHQLRALRAARHVIGATAPVLSP